MPGPGYIGQFGSPWTSMGGIMAVRQQIHEQQMDQNRDVRAKQQQGLAGGAGQYDATTQILKSLFQGQGGQGGAAAGGIGSIGGGGGFQSISALLGGG